MRRFIGIERKRFIMSLAKSRILIAGGSSGMGLALARRCLDAGARVVIVGRSEERLAQARSSLGAADALDTIAADITQEQQVVSLFERVGPLDIFHANAGSYVGGEVVEGDPDAWDRMLDLNINAAFRSVHAVLPHMVERRTGDIIMTSSISGLVPVVWEPIYTASKHAVQAFVHTVRRQVARHGIRVGAVAPGPVVTALIADWPQEKLDAARAAGDLMEASEVAAAVAFMLTRPRNVTIRDLVILPQANDL